MATKNEFERANFTFFESFYTAAQSLGTKDRAKYYDAIFQYALYGRKIELSGTVKALFELSEPVLNKGISQYKNGQSGGRPPKTQPKPNQNPTESQKKPTESQSEPTSLEEKDKEKEKDKDMDMECVKGEDGFSAVDGHTPDTPEKPSPNDVLLEAMNLGASMSVAEVSQFMAYNDASGWKLEWKYALKRWLDQEKQRPRGKPKIKTDPSESHVYDLAELRRRAKE